MSLTRDKVPILENLPDSFRINCFPNPKDSEFRSRRFNQLRRSAKRVFRTGYIAITESDNNATTNVVFLLTEKFPPLA